MSAFALKLRRDRSAFALKLRRDRSAFALKLRRDRARGGPETHGSEPRDYPFKREDGCSDASRGSSFYVDLAWGGCSKLRRKVSGAGQFDGDDGVGFEFVAVHAGLQLLGQRLELVVVAFGDHGRLAKGPAQVGVLECSRWAIFSESIRSFLFLPPWMRWR
jgi:hypothetical protein